MKDFVRNTYVIARNTFKESVRDKVFYVIFAFAFVFIGFTIFLGSISLGEDLLVVRALGLACVYFFGLLIAIFLGISLVYKELERRTLYFILSKPVTASEVILGKFAGLFSSVAVSICGMAAVYLAVVAFEGGGFDGYALIAILFELLELAVLVALSTFFSSFAKPLASALYALLIIYIGHSLDLLTFAVRNSGMFMQGLVKALYVLLPNLDKFNQREEVIAGILPHVEEAVFSLGYAAIYIAILLYAATILLHKRDL